MMPLPKDDLPELYEHERLSQIKDKSQVIGEFMEWLQGKGITPQKCGRGNRSYRFYVQKELAEFFKIDLEKLEKEKRVILEHLRKTNA